MWIDFDLRFYSRKHISTFFIIHFIFCIALVLSMFRVFDGEHAELFPIELISYEVNYAQPIPQPK
jgi:hypothetical protein